MKGFWVVTVIRTKMLVISTLYTLLKNVGGKRFEGCETSCGAKHPVGSETTRGETTRGECLAGKMTRGGNGLGVK